MVEGQSGHVFGLAPHPTLSRVYATACADGHVGLWDAEHRRNIKMVRVERGEPSKEGKRAGLAAGEHLKAWACCFRCDALITLSSPLVNLFIVMYHTILRAR